MTILDQKGIAVFGIIRQNVHLSGDNFEVWTTPDCSSEGFKEDGFQLPTVLNALQPPFMPAILHTASHFLVTYSPSVA